MAQKSAAASGSIGVFTVLGIVFLVLKLAHVIDWPWIWVLAPFWISIVLALVILTLLFLLFGFVAYITSKKVI